LLGEDLGEVQDSCVKKRAQITPELNDTKRVKLDVEEPTDTEEDILHPDTTLRGYSVSEIECFST
jgi:hypothetical protein